MNDCTPTSPHRPRLASKVAVITGAAGGIGRATAQRFAEEGASVALIDVEDADDVAADLRGQGGRAEFYKVDLSCSESVERFSREVARSFGRVDVLYNNAGGSSARDNSITDCEADELSGAIGRNLLPTWLCSRHFIPLMQQVGGGSIINTTSAVAQKGTPRKSAYTAAKGAIEALTRAMAIDYANDRIRVNAISPGGVVTERINASMERSADIRRLVLETSLLGPIEPAEIAAIAVYLGSEESRVTTGQVFRIDSGYTA